MSEFHDVYPDYEGMAHHDEPTGKKVRKKLWGVFWILLTITIVEVIIGLYASDWNLGKGVLKVVFIGLTLVKAAYIVMVFMHLKDESKWTKWVILIPYAVFIGYLLIMMTIGEGNYARDHRLNGQGTTEGQTGTIGVPHTEAAHDGASHDDGAGADHHE
jgi:caa(3)-type oxidase subunit IV